MSDLSAALKRIFTLDSFADGTAGAVGGTSAITVFYPLNIIRTKLQTDAPGLNRTMWDVVKEIIETDGPAGIFNGWWSQVVALGASNFVYFYCYNMLKVIVQKKTNRVITPGVNLVVGMAAGVINVLLTTPLWMISTQLATQTNQKARTKDDTKPVKQLEPYKGVWDGLVRCYQEEGVSGLFKGIGPNLTLVSNPTIHFFVYERCRLVMAAIAERRGSVISSLEFFLLGALAKAIATVATYPIQVAQSQLRNDRKNAEGKRQYTGTFDCLAKLYKAAGFGSWFQGMGAKLLQTVLTAAFQFMTYESMRLIVFKALTGKDLRTTMKIKSQ